MDKISVVGNRAGKAWTLLFEEFKNHLPSNAGVSDRHDLTAREGALLDMILRRDHIITQLKRIQKKIIHKLGGLDV